MRSKCSRWIVLAGAFVLLGAGSAVRGQDWQPLFDGQSLAGWQASDGSVVGSGWEAVDGTLHLRAGDARGGNIVTQREFGDFELVFEWKVAARGNNGIKYRVRDFDGEALGLEYQLIDDQDFGELRPEQTTGAIYDLFAPITDKLLRPAGQFNRSRIVVWQNHVGHWLNGRQVAAATIGSAEWRQRVAASKFHDRAGFGENVRGRIMLTDHHSEVWFRNVYLRELTSAEGMACGNAMASGEVMTCCEVMVSAPARACLPVVTLCSREGRSVRRCLLHNWQRRR